MILLNKSLKSKNEKIYYGGNAIAGYCLVGR